MPMRRLEREVSMKINMMLFVCLAATMAGNAFASSQLFAATFSVPTMPEAEWDDTEVVTNAALAANPPRFLYSPEWDTVRVACRGVDSPNPVIAGSIENFPLSIRIR